MSKKIELSCLFSNQNLSKYDDYCMNFTSTFIQIKYDKPAKMRNRDYLIRPGAFFFSKTKCNKWVLIGSVEKIDEHGSSFVTLTIKTFTKTETCIFKNKNEIVKALFGSELSLGSNEYIHGLIPIIIDS
jgi:hypothetical protein